MRLFSRKSWNCQSRYEIIHWHLHKKYFQLLALLDDEMNMMTCEVEPSRYDESMTMFQRAHWYAEWQANALAIRIAMPQELLKRAIYLLAFCHEPKTRQEIAAFLGVKTVFYAMQHYVQPLLAAEKLAMTIPEKPKSRNQKYYTVR